MFVIEIPKKFLVDTRQEVVIYIYVKGDARIHSLVCAFSELQGRYPCGCIQKMWLVDSMSNGKKILLLQMDIFFHFEFCHNR